MANSNDSQSELDFFSKVGLAFQMIKESWEALKLNISTFILVAIIPALIILVASMFFLIPIIAGANNANGLASVSAIFAGLILIAAIVVALIFLPALTITQLESVRGKKVSFGEVFEQSKEYVLRYIGIALLGGLIAAGPMLLSLILIFVFIGWLLLPFAYAWAVVVMFFLLMAPYVLITKNLGVIDSMKASYELTKKHWQWVLAIFIIQFAINIPSLIPFINIVGWMVTVILGVAYYCLPALIFVNKISPKTTPKKITSNN